MDSTIADVLWKWISNASGEWRSSSYVSLREALQKADDHSSLHSFHPEEIALALDDLVKAKKLRRKFLLVRADGKIVPGREYENVLDVPMADAKAVDALISPGYVIETREIQ